MVKCMKMLSNSTQGLFPYQKCLLYRTCILLIVLYGFSLWYYNNVPLLYPFKKLRKMQYRAVLWIFGTFHTSPTFNIEAITSLIPIYLHLQKLDRRQQLRIVILLCNHTIKSLLKNRYVNNAYSHHHFLEYIILKQ